MAVCTRKQKLTAITQIHPPRYKKTMTFPRPASETRHVPYSVIHDG